MPTSLATHKANRAAAGAAYAAAAAAFIAAYVELSAYDRTLSNGNVGGGLHVPSFGALPEVPAHGEFLPNWMAGTGGYAGDRIRVRADELIAS